MNLDDIVLSVQQDVQRHCRESKGYEESGWVNPLTPRDSVAAYALAKHLVEQNVFDQLVAVAPEGHVYGYFFEKLGNPALSVYVDYPPRRCEALDDLSVITGQRSLVLEDDVISGVTIAMVMAELLQHQPSSLSLLLGRAKEDQQLDSIPAEFEAIYLAEDVLNESLRSEYEREFIAAFGN